MPRPDAPPLTRGVVLRGIGFAVAVILSAVAVWLIATSTTVRSNHLGIVTGLWGVLIGAFSMFGARRTTLFDEPSGDHDSGSGLAIRGNADLVRAEDAAARGEFEARLEALIQREVSATFTREVSGLRGEIAQLRQDLLDKVGGQLRLERIETTRLIGSDLEALHHEVRQLKVANESGSMAELLSGATGQRLTSVHQVVEPAPPRPADHKAAARKAEAAQRAETERVEAERVDAERVEAERQEAERADTERVEAERAEAERVEAEHAAAETAAAKRAEGVRLEAERQEAERQEAERAEKRAAAQRAQAERVAAQRAEAERQAAKRADAERVEAEHVAAAAEDPFASLPRLRPFTDFPLDPTPSTLPASYTGRRRRGNGAEVVDEGDSDEGRPSSDVSGSGRHGGSVEGAPSSERGRRRRADERDAGGELLATLLARETAEREVAPSTSHSGR
ncbi:MAG: DUF6779 domain-containing protein [Jatrophihabitans sp.]